MRFSFLGHGVPVRFAAENALSRCKTGIVIQSAALIGERRF